MGLPGREGRAGEQDGRGVPRLRGGSGSRAGRRARRHRRADPCVASGSPDHRSCEIDGELIYDQRWDAMGVKAGCHDDVTYTGELLVAAHRASPNSAWRARTLFSTVLGETPWHGMGVMPHHDRRFDVGVPEVLLDSSDVHTVEQQVCREAVADYRGSSPGYLARAPFAGWLSFTTADVPRAQTLAGHRNGRYSARDRWAGRGGGPAESERLADNWRAPPI